MAARRKCFHAAIAVAILLVGSATSQANTIEPGFDLWETPEGGARLTIMGEEVVFAGVPLVSDPVLGPIPGNTDTIVQRMGSVEMTGTVPIELVALSLQSVEPVNIGGTLWDVDVGLDPSESSLGSLTVTGHTDDSSNPSMGGGTFDSSILVNALVTMREVGNPSNEMSMSVQDTVATTGTDWSHTPRAGTPIVPHLPNGFFFPGVGFHTGPHPITLPAEGEGVVRPDPILPPLCDPVFPDGYQIVEDKHAEWRDDPNQRTIDLTAPSIHCPTRLIERRMEGEDEIEVFDSSLSGPVVIRNDDGTTADGFLFANGEVQTRVNGRNNGQLEESGIARYETEILSMDLNGFVSGEFGDIPIQIRESPTQSSNGQTEITNVAGGFRVDSFFDVWTEVSVAGGDWLPPAQAGQVEYVRNERGDSDRDGDIDNTDLGTQFGNFTGPNGQDEEGRLAQPVHNESYHTGDTDGDRDVDNSDIGRGFANFNAGTDVAMRAGNLTDSASRANLLYDPSDGNVKLDASEAAGGVVTNFVLENAAGGSSFAAPGTAVFPFPGSFFTTDLTVEISQTDGSAMGFAAIHDLGDIFPTGLSITDLESFLTRASYVGSLGSGNPDFDLVVVPEPTGLAWGGFVALGFMGWMRRRRQR